MTAQNLLSPALPRLRMGLLWAAVSSLALHALVLWVWHGQVAKPEDAASPPPMPLHLSPAPEPAPRVAEVRAAPTQRPELRDAQSPRPVRAVSTHADRPAPPQPAAQPVTPPAADPPKALASMAAPPAPTAQEWQAASTYTLKNSKKYRYQWGQQVRSMMGIVVEGPQQGHVRLRIEIAPDGKVVKVDTLWSTSDEAEKLARQAIANLPTLPPTPTGLPLVFEQTIAYQPHESGWPPMYKHDCLPDPPPFRNPFVWDGSAVPAKKPAAHKPAEPVGQAPNRADCPNDAEPDSIEAEAADIKRQYDVWGVMPLNGVK